MRKKRKLFKNLIILCFYNISLFFRSIFVKSERKKCEYTMRIGNYSKRNISDEVYLKDIPKISVYSLTNTLSGISKEYISAFYNMHDCFPNGYTEDGWRDLLFVIINKLNIAESPLSILPSNYLKLEEEEFGKMLNELEAGLNQIFTREKDEKVKFYDDFYQDLRYPIPQEARVEAFKLISENINELWS